MIFLIVIKMWKVQSFIIRSISLNLSFKLRETKNGTHTNWTVHRVKICWNPIQSPLYTHSILTPAAIFQLHQRMEFTFHNSYIFLELVPSTMILWTELRCWYKSYLNKAKLLLSWSHRNKKNIYCHHHDLVDRHKICYVMGYSLTTCFWSKDTQLFNGHLGAFEALSHLMLSLQ